MSKKVPFSLNVQSLAADMVYAVRKSVSSRWPSVRAEAEVEMRKLAQTMLDIHKLHSDGEITKARARQLLTAQRNSTCAVLKGLKGIGLLTAEATTNAALRAVAKSVNVAVDFRLLPDGEEVTASFKAGKDL